MSSAPLNTFPLVTPPVSLNDAVWPWFGSQLQDWRRWSEQQARLDQSYQTKATKIDKSTPQRSQFFHIELLHWKDYSEVEHRYNRHTDNKPLHGMSTKLLLPLFAAALQGSDSLAQSRTPIHPRASEVRPSEGSMLENYFRFSHYSVALQRSHLPYLKGTWCCWNFVENEWKMASRNHSLQPRTLTDLKHVWLIKHVHSPNG